MSPAFLYKWTDTRRKAAASGIAGVIVVVYAFWTHAPFAEFANAVEWILGIFITGHAATDVLMNKKGLGIPAALTAPSPGIARTPPPLPRKP
jgi:hypothetical protein